MPGITVKRKLREGRRNRFIAASIKVIDHIRETYGKSDASGEIACPLCEVGTVRFVVNGFNGHTRGYCGTRGCLRWVEGITWLSIATDVIHKFA